MRRRPKGGLDNDAQDYGYFGKGADGYAHYMTAYNRNFGSGSGCIGCLNSLIILIIALALGAIFASQ